MNRRCVSILLALSLVGPLVACNSVKVSSGTGATALDSEVLREIEVWSSGQPMTQERLKAGEGQQLVRVGIQITTSEGGGWDLSKLGLKNKATNTAGTLRAFRLRTSPATDYQIDGTASLPGNVWRNTKAGMMVMMGDVFTPLANGGPAEQIMLVGPTPWPGGVAAIDAVFEIGTSANDLEITNE